MKQIKELNLFENEVSPTDSFQRRTAIISTRFYLALLSLTITVLVIYTALGYQTVTITIRNPNHTVYLDLYNQYPTTLSCPCSQIAIPYGTFISVSYQYHPVCSSVFVSNTWLDLLFNPNMSYFFQLDFRSSASGQFQLIRSLCSLVDRFVNDTLFDFLLDTFLTPKIRSVEALNAESLSKSTFVQISTANAVQQVLNLVRRTTQSNQLQTAMQTSKLNSLYIMLDSSVLVSIQGGAWIDKNGNYCFCGTTPTCSSPSGFFNLFAYESTGIYVPPKPPIAYVPGFVAGCYALESLLQSTLECFFDQECLNTVLRFFSPSNLTNIKALNETETQFPPQATIEFQLNTLGEFKRALALIQVHTSNTLSTTQLNAYLATYEFINSTTRIDFGWVPWHWDNCSCSLSDTCHVPMGFYTYPPNYPVEDMILKFYIPNLFVGCFVVENVLQSSLQCFFNQSCLDAIQREIKSNASIDVPILNINSTRFLPETPIHVLVNSLLLEQWHPIIQYDKYYLQCSPKSCSYKFTARNNALYVFTMLVGLIGGLTAALKLAVPKIVGSLRNCMRPRNETNHRTTHLRRKDRVRAIWYKLKTQAVEFNMFNSEETCRNDYVRRISVMSTRVYLLLLTGALIILTTHNTLTIHTQQFVVNEPSQSTFEQLQANPQYSSTLECPCQKIAIAFNSFISISVHFHQFCSSDFVVKSSEWMNILYYRWVAFVYPYDDFRLFVLPHFRLLNSFCILANETVVNALGQFASNTLISSRAQSHQSIEIQVTAAIDQLRRSTSATFIRMLDFVRQIAHGNGIVFSTLSNWHFLSLNTSVSWTSLWAEPRSYGNCSCGANPTCTSPAFIDHWSILGFLVGCDPLEALLQSTLACLYDISCINRIQFMYYSSNLIMQPLNRTLSAPNVPVQSLLKELMVDQWETSVNYERHFEACAPLTCTYSLNTQADLLYIVTTTIGVYGGINVALKLIVPYLVKMVHHLLIDRRRRIQPMIDTISHSQ
ncbi:unnamed protein product [Rotaria sp. Silwood1]|nr:unnamed protein product [Rotaria sp. Silwood1]